MNQPQRILIALDASPGSIAALEHTARLAQRLKAQLTALFVQDENLLRLSHLPFAREVRYSSGQRHGLSAERIEKDLQQQQQWLEQEIERIQRAIGVHCALQIRRGTLTREITLAASQQDLLALGMASLVSRQQRLGSTARRLLAESTSPLLLVGAKKHEQDSLMVVLDGSPSSQRALDNALKLTTATTTLHLLLCAEHSQTFASLEAWASPLLHQGKVHWHQLLQPNTDDLLRTIIRLHPSTLVVGDLDWLEPGALAWMAERLDGAVLRFR